MVRQRAAPCAGLTRCRIQPEHLDMSPQLFHSPKLLVASKQLFLMDDFLTPRDKLICVLNCCKLLYGARRTHAGLCACAPDACIWCRRGGHGQQSGR